MKRKAVLILVLILSFFSTHLWKQSLEQDWLDRKYLELDQEAKLLRVQIHNVFTSSFAELTSLASLFKIHPQTSTSEFNRFAKSIIEVHPEIKATQFANRETQIIYVYPVENNEITLEQPMVLLKDPLRASLTRKAIETKNLTVQDPFILRQGSMGTVVRLPVFHEESLLGLVIGVYDIEALVKRVFPDNKSGLYSVRFTDSAGHIFYGREKFASHFVEGEVNVGSSTWNVAIGWQDKPMLPFYLRFGMFYLLSGCLILIVLFFINKAWLYNQFLQTSIQKVSEKTKELQHKNLILEIIPEKLSKYLPPQIYESIFQGERDVEIKTERKKLTVFFSDIQEFTSTTEDMQPEDLTFLLNEYFSEMSAIATKHGGTIDKFIGDAMLIFFGDPQSKGVKQDAISCVEMAVEMQQKMSDLQEKWLNTGYKKPFHMRIGINSGYCNVGNFGSNVRMDYTIIGEEVNLAARLQSAADPDGIMISYETYALIKDFFKAEKQNPIHAKGIHREIHPYALTEILDQKLVERTLIRKERNGMLIVIDLNKMSEHDRKEALSEMENIIQTLKK